MRPYVRVVKIHEFTKEVLSWMFDKNGKRMHVIPRRYVTLEELRKEREKL